MTIRKSYTREFKLEAVRLLEEGIRTPAEIARELGIKRTLLYRWREQINEKGEAVFPGGGRRSPADAELARLKRENERLKEENEILKKAAKYFARESG